MRYPAAIFCLLSLPALFFAGCRSHTAAPQVINQPVRENHGKEKSNTMGVDKSPMDMSYYPVGYPVLKMSDKAVGPPVARIIYSRPLKDGRTIFGNVVKFGSRWRMGANEATELEFFQPVTIQQKAISKGRYILYCIPFEDRWTLILNKDLFTWGLKIDSAKDVASFNVPVAKAAQNYEVFTIEFEPSGNAMNLVIAWDNVKALLPIAY